MRLARRFPYADRFWEAPIFDAVRSVAAKLPRRHDFPTVGELDAALFAPLRARGISVHLEVQEAGPRPKHPPLSDRYDVRIAEAGVVPTRERSWHDLMNALVFAAFPKTKLAIHRRHAGELAAHYARHGGLPNARSRLQDVLALFDEGGVVVVATNGDTGALARAAAAEDLATIRARVGAGSARLAVLGHAVLEHAVMGEELPRAMPLVLPDAVDLDTALADAILALDAGTRRAALPLASLFSGPRVDGGTARA